MTNGPAGILGPQTVSILIGLAIVVPILLLRNARPRKLKIERLWIRPAIWAVVAAMSFSRAPPPLSPIGLAMLAASLALGCALGWQRGRLMRIEVDPVTHEMTLRASPAAMIFIIVLMLLRMSVRDVAVQSLGQTHLPVTILVDGLVLFSLGLMLTQSVEMGVRASRLLTRARAASASRPG